MKVEELRVLEIDELGVRMKSARRELYELRFKHAVGQLENTIEISKVRHDIARIMTVLRERDLGIVMASPAGDSELEQPASLPEPLQAAPSVEAEKAAKPKRTRKKAEDKT